MFQVFAGVIAEGHWERFNYYARRVKFLTALAPRPGNTRITVSDYVYLHIAQVRLSHSSAPLFPALQRLCIPDIPNPPSGGIFTPSIGLSPPSIGLSSAFLVSSPSLESVELHSEATSDPQFFASYLSFLVAESAPTLRRLILRGDPRTESLALLSHLRNIRTLEISFPKLSFSPDLFGTLASLEYLSDLVLDYAPPSSRKHKRKGMGLARATDGVALLKLDQINNLQITGSPTALSHVLGQLRAPRLKSMVIKIRVEKTSEPRPFTSLDSECFKDIANLTSISSIHITETESSFVILSIADIRPILTLSQLEDLEISVHSMTGGDEVIQEISSNLPILKTLILPSSRSQFGFFPKNPTFHSLDILAYNCPDLIQLKLAIDLLADSPPSYNNIAAVRQRSHPLKALYIADAKPSLQPSTVAQVIAIVRRIDQIFSNLEFVGHYASGNKFTELEEFWSAFQAVRRDIRESLVAKTPQSYVSKSTQTTYMPVAGGIDFT